MNDDKKFTFEFFKNHSFKFDQSKNKVPTNSTNGNPRTKIRRHVGKNKKGRRPRKPPPMAPPTLPRVPITNSETKIKDNDSTLRTADGPSSIHIDENLSDGGSDEHSDSILNGIPLPVNEDRQLSCDNPSNLFTYDDSTSDSESVSYSDTDSVPSKSTLETKKTTDSLHNNAIHSGERTPTNLVPPTFTAKAVSTDVRKPPFPPKIEHPSDILFATKDGVLWVALKGKVSLITGNAVTACASRKILLTRTRKSAGDNGKNWCVLTNAINKVGLFSRDLVEQKREFGFKSYRYDDRIAVQSNGNKETMKSNYDKIKDPFVVASKLGSLIRHDKFLCYLRKAVLQIRVAQEHSVKVAIYFPNKATLLQVLICWRNEIRLDGTFNVAKFNEHYCLTDKRIPTAKPQRIGKYQPDPRHERHTVKQPVESLNLNAYIHNAEVTNLALVPASVCSDHVEIEIVNEDVAPDKIKPKRPESDFRRRVKYSVVPPVISSTLEPKAIAKVINLKKKPLVPSHVWIKKKLESNKAYSAILNPAPEPSENKSPKRKPPVKSKVSGLVDPPSSPIKRKSQMVRFDSEDEDEDDEKQVLVLSPDEATKILSPSQKARLNEDQQSAQARFEVPEIDPFFATHSFDAIHPNHATHNYQHGDVSIGVPNAGYAESVRQAWYHYARNVVKTTPDDTIKNDVIRSIDSCAFNFDEEADLVVFPDITNHTVFYRHFSISNQIDSDSNSRMITFTPNNEHHIMLPYLAICYYIKRDTFEVEQYVTGEAMAIPYGVFVKKSASCQSTVSALFNNTAAIHAEYMSRFAQDIYNCFPEHEAFRPNNIHSTIRRSFKSIRANGTWANYYCSDKNAMTCAINIGRSYSQVLNDDHVADELHKFGQERRGTPMKRAVRYASTWLAKPTLLKWASENISDVMKDSNDVVSSIIDIADSTKVKSQGRYERFKAMFIKMNLKFHLHFTLPFIEQLARLFAFVKSNIGVFTLAISAIGVTLGFMPAALSLVVPSIAIFLLLAFIIKYHGLIVKQLGRLRALVKAFWPDGIVDRILSVFSKESFSKGVKHVFQPLVKDYDNVSDGAYEFRQIGQTIPYVKARHQKLTYDKVVQRPGTSAEILNGDPRAIEAYDVIDHPQSKKIMSLGPGLAMPCARHEITTSNSLFSEETRQFRILAVAEKEAIDDWNNWCNNKVSSGDLTLFPKAHKVETLAKWLKTRDWDAAKKKATLEAPRDTSRRISGRQFVKPEFVNKDPTLPPRSIHASKVSLKKEFGPHIHAYSKGQYSHFRLDNPDNVRNIVYCSGKSRVKVGAVYDQIMKEIEASAYHYSHTCLDVSKLDSSMPPEVLSVPLQCMYSVAFDQPDIMLDYANQCCQVKIHTSSDKHASIKYKMRGLVGSGEPGTTCNDLGFVILVVQYVLERVLGKKFEKWIGKFYPLHVGDDIHLIWPDEMREEFERSGSWDMARAIGIIFKEETFDCLCKSEFLQSHPLRTGYRLSSVRRILSAKIGRILLNVGKSAKSGATNAQLCELAAHKWRSAANELILPNMKNFCINTSRYFHKLANGTNLSSTFVDKKIFCMGGAARAVNETYIDYGERYGMSAEAIRSFDEFFGTLPVGSDHMFCEYEGYDSVAHVFRAILEKDINLYSDWQLDRFLEYGYDQSYIELTRTHYPKVNKPSVWVKSLAQEGIRRHDNCKIIAQYNVNEEQAPLAPILAAASRRMKARRAGNRRISQRSRWQHVKHIFVSGAKLVGIHSAAKKKASETRSKVNVFDSRPVIQSASLQLVTGETETRPLPAPNISL
jgi:hypothetical protein